MHSRRIVRRIRPPRWCGAGHRTPNSVHYKIHITDIAPQRRSDPAAASEDLENRLTFQSVRRLYMTDRRLRVRASSDHFAEGASRNVADPVGDAAMARGLG